MNTQIAGYEFFLNPYMPKGFLQNNKIPQIPAAIKYLKQFDGNYFSSLNQFQRTLDGYLSYLKEQKVTLKHIPIRYFSLCYSKIDEPREDYGRKWAYVVLTKQNEITGICVLGGLEEKHLQK